MPSQISTCPTCAGPGCYGTDDDWCHEVYADAIRCPREGWYPGQTDADGQYIPSPPAGAAIDQDRMDVLLGADDGEADITQTRQVGCQFADCPGFAFRLPAAITAADVERLAEAQNAHGDWHRAEQSTGEVHIRRQINPRRIQTGNQFYKDRVQLSAAENGSQTLCGSPATVRDLSWAETRYAKNLAHVTCAGCTAARQPQPVSVTS